MAVVMIVLNGMLGVSLTSAACATVSRPTTR